jgi:hypothetical protein
MSTVKEKLAKLGTLAKQLLAFSDELETPAPIELAEGEYKLADGTIVKCASLEVRQPVTLVTAEGEMPAPEGNHTLEDGRVLTVDASGNITAIAEKPADDGGEMKFAELSADEIKTLLAKFAENVPAADQGSAVVACVKALMEYNFGWKISESARKAQEDAAIAAYTSVLEAKFSALITEKDEKISAIEKANGILIEQGKKQALAFSQLLEAVEEMGAATPAPISEQKSAPQPKDLLGYFKKQN